MILIENCEKTQNNIQIETTAELMFADKCVEIVRIRIDKYGIHITPTELYIRDLLPKPLLANQTNLLNWFIWRGLIRKSHRNIFYTNLVLDIENRDLDIPLILSLSTNSVSLSDKYWLNPKESVEFIVNGAKVSFIRKTWSEADPFMNKYYPRDLEKYGLYDYFAFEEELHLDSISLIWTTFGDQNKRWLLDDNGYYLEKKLGKTLLEDELHTLDFFALNGVLVPKYNYYHQLLGDKKAEYDRFYDWETIGEGLHVIQKRCLTDSNSYLEYLSDYVDNDDVIELPIRRMFSQYKVQEKEIDRFVQVLKAYQLKFDVEDSFIDMRNLGLLIDENGAYPVVWGRLRRTRLWTGRLEE